MVTCRVSTIYGCAVMGGGTDLLFGAPRALGDDAGLELGALLLGLREQRAVPLDFGLLRRQLVVQLAPDQQRLGRRRSSRVLEQRELCAVCVACA